MNRKLLAVCGAILLGALAITAQADCRPDRVDLRGDWGTARFAVEIADTPKSRSRGLMHREHLPRRHGMLFLFGKPQPVSFWMKNTFIPLDMLFFDKTGQLVSLNRNAEPFSTVNFHGGQNVFAVLEINGGLSEQFGIETGTEIRHPAFEGSDVVWTCKAGF